MTNSKTSFIAELHWFTLVLISVEYFSCDITERVATHNTEADPSINHLHAPVTTIMFLAVLSVLVIQIAYNLVMTKANNSYLNLVGRISFNIYFAIQ